MPTVAERRLRPLPVRPLAASAALALLVAPAFAQEPTGVPKRPAPQLIPQNEDWSVVDQVEGEDPYDRFKWMALDDAGDWRLTLGMSSRLRVEAWHNFVGPSAANTGQDDIYPLFRVLGHADLRHSSGARAFFELKSALAWDRDLPGGVRPLDEDELAVQQAFLEYGHDLGEDGRLTGRVGRQMLSYGRQRLVSPLPWGNSLRSWDAALARYQGHSWSVDAIGSQFVFVDSDQANDWKNPAGTDEQLFGLYATHTLPDKSGMDVYWLLRSRDFAAPVDDDRHTVGVRSWGELFEFLEVESEFGYQFGEVGSGDVSATMFGLELAHRIDDGPVRLKLGVEYGSGDGAPGGNVGTFDPMYPLGHAYYGIIDVVGRQNGIDYLAGASWNVTETLQLDLVGHVFRKDESADFVYNAGGGIYAGTAGGSSDIGQEIDLVLKGKLNRNAAWELGYGRFFAGDAFADQGGYDDDTDFVYAQVSYAF